MELNIISFWEETLNNVNLKTVNTCLSFITFVVLAMVLRATASIMIPFVLALFFTLVITPAVSFIQRKVYNSRTLAFFIFFSFLTLFVLGVIYICGDSNKPLSKLARLSIKDGSNNGSTYTNF